MSVRNGASATEPEVYTIIVHASPPNDAGHLHWTEAPECPAAHEGGKTADEVVQATMEGIRAWHADHVGGDESIDFRVEDTR